MVSLPFPFLLLGFSCPPASWGPSMFLVSGLSVGERLASVRAPAGPGVPVQGLPSPLFTLWLLFPAFLAGSMGQALCPAHLCFLEGMEDRSLPAGHCWALGGPVSPHL